MNCKTSQSFTRGSTPHIDMTLCEGDSAWEYGTLEIRIFALGPNSQLYLSEWWKNNVETQQNIGVQTAVGYLESPT